MSPVTDRNRHAAGSHNGTNAIGGQFAPEPPRPEGAPIAMLSPTAEIEEFIANATLDYNMGEQLNLDRDHWLILAHADGDFDGAQVGFDSLELHWDDEDGLEAVAVAYLDTNQLSADADWVEANTDEIARAFDEVYPGANIDIDGDSTIARLDVAPEDATEPETFRDALTLIAQHEVATNLAEKIKTDRVWAPVRAKLAERIPVPMPLTEIRFGDAVFYNGDFLGIAGQVHAVQGTYRPTNPEEASRAQVRVAFASGSATRGDATDVLTVDRSGLPLPYDARSNDYWANVSAAADGRQEPDLLFQIAVDQPEDDFKLAIARNPKAQADALDVVAEYHGHPSRLAVIDHPNTDPRTIQRILDEAIAEEKTERQRAKGVSPMQQHYTAMADSAALVATAARARLAGVTPSTSES